MGSYPTISPLLCSDYSPETERYIFCGTVRQDISRHRCPRVSQIYRFRLRGVPPYGVRTFLFQPELKAILRPFRTAAKLRSSGLIDKRCSEDVLGTIPGYYPINLLRRDPYGARNIRYARNSDSRLSPSAAGMK